MKYIIILIFIPSLISAQSFRLPEPDVDKIKKVLMELNEAYDPTYVYLTHNFDSISSKTDILKLEYPNYSVCSFNQRFQENIFFKLDECKEAGGKLIEIHFPKTSMSDLRKWIEGIYNFSPMDIEHNWNQEQSTFGPLDNGAGCYFEINQLKNQSIIKHYCGC